MIKCIIAESDSVSLFETNIPCLFLIMWLISSNIITGRALAKDSSTTFGCA